MAQAVDGGTLHLPLIIPCGFKSREKAKMRERGGTTWKTLELRGENAPLRARTSRNCRNRVRRREGHREIVEEKNEIE